MDSEELKEMYNTRLGRYQAAIALEPTDRMPIATGSNYFAEVYSGNTHQETIYDPERWLAAEMEFIRAFPEVDVLRDNRIYGPLFDAMGCRTYRLPGRDLPPGALRHRVRLASGPGQSLAPRDGGFGLSPLIFAPACIQ